MHRWADWKKGFALGIIVGVLPALALLAAFIGRWVRKFINYSRKAPNHSWRRFKDECRNAGIAKEVHDALMGHAAGDEGDKYGLGYSRPVLAEAIGKLPTAVA